MNKWEYQTIEVIRGRVNQVNNKVINKTDGKLLSAATLFTLDEYLHVIGEEGWELVLSGGKSLLYSPDKADDKDTIVLIAKRQTAE